MKAPGSIRRTLARPLLWLVLGWVVIVAVAPFVGSHALAPGELLSLDSTDGTIFWKLRLPRVLLAALAGGALAVSGVVLQTLFRNPLAEPYTLGVASGAALGAVLALQLEGRGWPSDCRWSRWRPLWERRRSRRCSSVWR